MVYGLEVPAHFTTVGIQRDDGRAVGIYAIAFPAKQVRSRVAGGHIDQAAFRVAGDGRPDIGAALVVARATEAVAMPLAVVSGDRFPGPRQLPRTRIERAHDTGGNILALVVRNQRANHRQVILDPGRRGRVVHQRFGTADIFFQGNTSCVAKICTGLTAARIQRNQLGIARAIEDAHATARGRLVRLRGTPQGHAAAHHRVHAAAAVFHLGIKHPALFTGFGVQGKHTPEWGAVVECVAVNQGCHL